MPVVIINKARCRHRKWPFLLRALTRDEVTVVCRLKVTKDRGAYKYLTKDHLRTTVSCVSIKLLWGGSIREIGYLKPQNVVCIVWDHKGETQKALRTENVRPSGMSH